MRIVHVNPFFYPYRGGIEHRIHHVCRLLGEEHEVSVLTGRLPGTETNEDADGYDVVRLPSRLLGSYNPQYIISSGILEAIESMEPDVVEFHYRWAPSYTRELVRHRGPKVFTWHNSFGEGVGLVQKLGSQVNDRLFLPKLKGFQAITCVSEYVRQELVRHGVDADKLDAIPPCHQVVFPAEPRERDEGYLLFVGRLVRTKGLDHLMRAMSSLDHRLVICGVGPEMERLRSIVRRRGLEDRVEFRGYVSDEERGDLLEGCSAYVMPSIFESFGLAAAEAMIYGKPVVYGDVGGLPEVVRDAGLPVPPGDSGAIVEAVELLMADEGMRREMGRRGREYARCYSWEGVAERTLEQYERLL